MSWQLFLYDQTGNTVTDIFDDNNPGAIVGGFSWRDGTGGDCKQLVFSAVPSLMPWPIDMCAVMLRIDGQDAFFGVISQFWSRDEVEAREYVAVGLSEIYKRRYALAPRYDEQPIEAIVNDLLAKYRHPLSYVKQVEATGQTATVRAPGPVDLNTLISDLAKKVGFIWGVDAAGGFFFRPPTSTETADYRIQGINHIPANASDMATKGIIFGGEYTAGGDLTFTITDSSGIDTVVSQQASVARKSLIAEYEAPEHSTYGLEKAAASPVLKTSPWANPSAPSAASIIKLLGGANQTFSGPMVCSTVGGVSSTIDETSPGVPNELTGWKANVGIPAGVYIWLDATWTITLPSWAVWNPDGQTALKVGIKSNKTIGSDYTLTVKVQYPDPDSPSLTLTNTLLEGASLGTSATISLANIPATATVSLIFSPATNYTPPACSGTPDWIKITYVQGWGIIIPDAEAKAQSLVSLPYKEPSQVEWIGSFINPTDQVTLTTQSSSATTLVSEWEYYYTPDEIKSTAKLGDRGVGDSALVLRILVSDTGERAAIIGKST